MHLNEGRDYKLNVEAWEKGGFLREDTDLAVSGGELLHAAVTAVIPEDGIFLQSPGEDLYRRLSLVEYALEARGEYLRKSPRLLELDESARGMVSYYLGMIVTKLVGARLYGTEFLAPVQEICGSVRYRGRRRPDLIGYGKEGLQVWEAIGRSNNSGKALEEGCRLAGDVVSFGGERPSWAGACMTYYGSRCLAVRIKEAERQTESSEGLVLGSGREEFFRAYYRRLLRLAGDCYERESVRNRIYLGEDRIEAEIPAPGGRRLRIGFPRRLFLVGEGESLEETAPEKAGKLPDGAYMGADGISVLLC